MYHVGNCMLCLCVLQKYCFSKLLEVWHLSIVSYTYNGRYFSLNISCRINAEVFYDGQYVKVVVIPIKKTIWKQSSIYSLQSFFRKMLIWIFLFVGVDTVLTSTTSNLNQLILSVLKVGGKYLDLSSDFNNNSLGKFSVACWRI